MKAKFVLAFVYTLLFVVALFLIGYCTRDTAAQSIKPTSTVPAPFRPTITPKPTATITPGKPLLDVQCNESAICDVRIYPNGFNEFLVLSVEISYLVYWEPLVFDDGWGIRFYFAAAECSGFVTEFELHALDGVRTEDLLPRREYWRWCGFVPLTQKDWSSENESSGNGWTRPKTNDEIGSAATATRVPTVAARPDSDPDWGRTWSFYACDNGSQTRRICVQH